MASCHTSCWEAHSTVAHGLVRIPGFKASAVGHLLSPMTLHLKTKDGNSSISPPATVLTPGVGFMHADHTAQSLAHGRHTVTCSGCECLLHTAHRPVLSWLLPRVPSWVLCQGLSAFSILEWRPQQSGLQKLQRWALFPHYSFGDQGPESLRASSKAFGVMRVSRWGLSGSAAFYCTSCLLKKLSVSIFAVCLV